MEVARDGVSLLEAIREDLGVTSVKDGCSPQGQCGCCTVLIDGTPRVACVTPVRRAADREVTTVDGLRPERRERLVDAFVGHGASQCGFCTPGILCRLAALEDGAAADRVESALLAHLCRCTGWRSIVDAGVEALAPGAGPGAETRAARADAEPARRRAALEGGVPQDVGPHVVLGRAGFADDTAPAGCLVAVPDPAGGWAVGETLAEARAAAGKIQGRRSGQPPAYPVDVPPGDWEITLQTTWVEPAYLEPDASWCLPGGEPYNPAYNRGAFGAKTSSPAPAAARQLADEHGRAVRVVLSREDTVRMGPKRPPVAAGLRRDGTGVLRVAVHADAPGDTQALEAARRGAGPGLSVEPLRIEGPPVSAAIRGAGWAEAAALTAAAAALRADTTGATVETPEGARATAVVATDEQGWPTHVDIEVEAGDPLDEVVLSSYVQGAAHMALGWVCSEAIAVGPDGVPEDLTIRSFGVLRARDTPRIEVRISAGGGPPAKASDAVFAAVAASAWLAQGLPSRWPTKRGAVR